MIRKILLTLCFITILPLSAQAKPEINDAGAAELKKIITDMFEEQVGTSGLKGLELVKEGEITVEQAPSYYAITLPAIELIAEEGFKVKIGLTTINAVPNESNDKEWKMSMAIPTPILFSTNKGKVYQINIRKQKNGGTWNSDLNTFSKFASIYEDISLDTADGQTIFNLKNAITKSNYVEIGDNKWKGDVKFTASDLSIIDPEKKVNFHVGGISMLSDIDGYDPEIGKKYKKEMMGEVDKIETLTAEMLSKDKKPSPERVTQIQKELDVINNNILSSFGLILKSFNRSTSSFSLQDIDVSGVNKKTGETEGFKLGSLLFNLGVDGLTRENINGLFSISYDDLKLPSNKENTELVPTKLKQKITLNNLPINQLIEMGKNLSDANKKNPDSAKMMALGSLMSLKDTMAKAGASIKISDSHMSNDIYSAKIDGAINANASSKFGAIGDLTIVTTGLDKTISILENKASAEADPAKKQKAMMAIGQLQTLNQFSAPNGNEKICKLSLDAQGNTLVNGMNLQEVMSGGAPAQ